MERRRGMRPGTRSGRARMGRVTALAATVVAVLLGVAVLIIPAVSSAAHARVRVGVAPRVPSGARDLGAVAGSSAISGAVVLRPRDEAALKQLIVDASDKSSAQFGRYLSRGQFAVRFGPTAATVRAVRAQLLGAGLRVTGVSSDDLLVDFEGSASQAERAFSTSIGRYRLPDGSTGIATTGAIAVEPSIAGSVAGVLGLNELVHEHPALIRTDASRRSSAAAPQAAQFAHPAGSPKACGEAKRAAAEYGGLTDRLCASAEHRRLRRRGRQQ